MMQRFGFEHGGLTLSYLDTGGDRPLIIALHAMWMEARSFEDFAASMHFSLLPDIQIACAHWWSKRARRNSTSR